MTGQAGARAPAVDTRPMSEESQIQVPASFLALYLAEGRVKPTASRQEIAQRYEWCEDFAQMLLERARTLRWELGVTDEDVVSRMGAGLVDIDLFNPAEQQWVLTRLAELLRWGGTM